MKYCKLLLAIGLLGLVTAMDTQGADPLIRLIFDGNSVTNCGTGGTAYDGVLKGTAYQFTNGVIGTGLHVFGTTNNATRGYIEIKHTLGNSGSVAFWYKPESFFNFNSMLDNSAGADVWEFWIYGTSQPRFRIGPDVGDAYQDNFSSYYNGSNVWYHFTVTWDRYAVTNQTKLYVNGALVSMGQANTWHTPGQYVYLGGGSSGNTPGRGVFDDVRFYDVTLSAPEVKAVHAEVAELAPAVHITLDESAKNIGSGGSRYDATIYGTNIVWTNGVNRKSQALALDGVTNVVAVPYRISRTSGTVALWCYTPAPWYSYNSIFDNSVGGNEYECWLDNSGWLNFRPYNTGATATINLGAGSNRWHHIVCTWDQGTSEVALYLNGRLASLKVAPDSSIWTQPGTFFYLGGGHVNNTFARNFSADLQIFETALSSNRAVSLYYDYYRARGGLKAHVPFERTFEDIVGSNAVVVRGTAPEFVRAQIGRGISYQPEETPGTGGNCVSISNVLGSCDGAITAWFYVRAPFYNWIPLFDNESNNEFWEGWIYDNSTVAMRVSNLGNSGQTTYGLNNLSGPDNWYHFAWVWNLAEASSKLYVNGVLRSTARLNEAGWRDPHPNLNIGSFQASNKVANGIWDEVRVYDRALTDAEVAELAIIPPPPPPSGTIFMLQ